MPEIICLQHVPFEGPAYLETWLAGRGVKIRKIPAAGEALPDPGDCRSVIVMGGPMNIYQHRDHPWLPVEKAFIRECLRRGVPLLGVCLGAQLLADALGARVVQNAHREIGWFPVRLTAEIRNEFPALPAELNVLHWHGDTFELPRGAVRLAGSEACAEQGFYLPGRCLALQFHVETTPESLRGLLENCADELVPGPFVQSRAAIEEGISRRNFLPWESLLARALKV